MRLPPLRLPVIAVLRTVLLLGAVLAVLTLAARGVSPPPDLVLVTVLAVALRSGPVGGAGFGLLAGWLLDLVPPGASHPGTTALLYAAAGAFGGRWRRSGPVGAAWLALVGLATAVLTQAVPVVVGLATSIPVDLPVVGARVAFTTVAAAVALPVLLRLETGIRRRGLS
jgi:rod shape-determining protein MreD